MIALITLALILLVTITITGGARVLSRSDQRLTLTSGDTNKGDKIPEGVKALPESCDLFVTRIFERRLVEQGVIKDAEMSTCENAAKCPECKETYDIRLSEKIYAIQSRVAERKALEDKRSYYEKKWHVVKTENGKTLGYWQQQEDGRYRIAGPSGRPLDKTYKGSEVCLVCCTPRDYDGWCSDACMHQYRRNEREWLDKERRQKREYLLERESEQKRKLWLNNGLVLDIPDSVPTYANAVVRNNLHMNHLDIQWRWTDKDTGASMGAKSIQYVPR